MLRERLRGLTVRALRAGLRRLGAEPGRYPRDFGPAEVGLCEAVAPYTMTSPERVVALRDAVRYVVARGLPGAFVECGVWRGGSMMVVARTLLELGAADRELYLFDTFAGMPPPADVDRSLEGRHADDEWAARAGDAPISEWCRAGLAEVERNLLATGYPAARLHLVPGLVEETLPAGAPAAIALLRLDTDWYSSTRHELEHLYPRLAPGAPLMVDDYGHWGGARQAVDEYFVARGEAVLLQRVDYTARLLVKPPLGDP
ncbi:MAG: TylF/MycF/NovP-related O-methyltransferase [Planctomycetota bacterium]